MSDHDADNVVRRLMYWRDLPKGTPLPTDMGGSWDDLIRTMCVDAIIVIERLRGETFRLRQQLGHETKSFRNIKDALPHQFDEPAKLKSEGTPVPDKDYG